MTSIGDLRHLGRTAAVAIAAMVATGAPLPVFAANATADKPQAAAQAPASTTQRTETTVYGGWTVICNQTVGSDTPAECAAQLRVVDPSTNNVIVFWQIATSATGLAATIQTPTGVQIKPGIELAIGTKTVSKIDFDDCSPQNCEAVAPIDAATVSAVQAATDVTFTVTAKDGRQIHFAAKLDGAKDALAALSPKGKK